MLVRLQSGTASGVKIEVISETNHDIVFKGKTVIGRLQLVGSITLIDVHWQDTTGQGQGSTTPNGQLTAEIKSDNITEQTSYLDCLAAIDLGDFTEGQWRQAQQMIVDEAETFSVDDADICCIPGFQINTSLINNQPVRQSYSHIPKPLYAEVKHYIKYLLNRGWIHPLRSS